MYKGWNRDDDDVNTFTLAPRELFDTRDICCESRLNARTRKTPLRLRTTELQDSAHRAQLEVVRGLVDYRGWEV